MTEKKLFRIDLLGAIISVLFLGWILVRYNDLIGMPVNVLYILAAFAMAFAIYDTVCLMTLKEKWKPYLRVIAITNLLYALLSTILMYFHYKGLTKLGVIYFVAEILILIVISAIEIKASKS